MREEVKKYETQPEQCNYMSVIKLLYDNKLLDLNDEAQMNYVVSEIYNFLIAGKDTTMSFSQMALYYLATMPDIRSKVEAEVLAPEKLDFDCLKNWKYLDAFMNEVSRVYGPAQ